MFVLRISALTLLGFGIPTGGAEAASPEPAPCCGPGDEVAIDEDRPTQAPIDGKFVGYGGPGQQFDVKVSGTVLRVEGDQIFLQVDPAYHGLTFPADWIVPAPGTSEYGYWRDFIQPYAPPYLNVETYAVGGRPHSNPSGGPPTVCAQGGTICPPEQRRGLQRGDRINVAGLLVTDYGHNRFAAYFGDSYCEGGFPSARACKVHTELHPYRFSDLELNTPRTCEPPYGPGCDNRQQVTLALPRLPEIWSQYYAWNRVLGVAGDYRQERRQNWQSVTVVIPPPARTGSCTGRCEVRYQLLSQTDWRTVASQVTEELLPNNEGLRVTLYSESDAGLLPTADSTTLMQREYSVYWVDVPPSTIFGYHDSASVANLSGWACDSRDFSRALAIHLYATNVAGGPCLYEFGPPICFVGAVTADIPREPAVGTWCGGYVQHGFQIPAPAVLTDGREHQVYAFAITLDGPSRLLAGSPRWLAGVYWPLIYSEGNARRAISTGDWAPYNYKAECGVAEPMVGLSRSTVNTWAHAALCRSDDGPRYPHGPCWGLDFSTRDNRYTFFTGDWDPGYHKGECAPDEYVGGIGQGTNGRTNAILCCLGGVGHNACATRVLNADDSRETTITGDWDPYFWKGECGEGRYVAGASRDRNNGTPHAILCCSP